jgi:hypothetical protein
VDALPCLPVKGKLLLPIVLMVLFALTRWPGFMPWNFSAVYALVFCAGVYFPKRLAWWLPLVTMAVTDLLLNWYYHNKYHTPLFSPELIGNYLAYVVLIWLGRKFSAKASFVSLLAGGLLGAILFYFITNTFSWFFNPFNNPEYTKTPLGWFIALTRGTSGWPQTWEFFRNSLMSGGLFTGIFAGAMKLMEAAESAEEKEPKEKTEEAPQQPEEAKA